MKKHFVPQGRSYGMFAVISTVILLGILGLAYIQFAPMRYKPQESVSVQLIQPKQKIVTLINQDEIEQLYKTINDVDKSFDGFKKPSNPTGYLFQTNLKNLNNQKEKFQEVEPTLVWEAGHIFQGAKSYKLTQEGQESIERFILNIEE